MELSKRLTAVAALVTPGSRLADVGTDHGYIPIWLVKNGRIPCAVAMDVNKGPLLRAEENIREEGLEEKIETRLSDGLKELCPGEADAAVIAGMGGALTIYILEAASRVLPGMKELILQPQSEIAKVRRWLEDQGWQIAEEDMVEEDGKYYPMMKAVHGQQTRMRKIDACYGPVLLKKKHPCLLQYLQWERQVKEKVLQQLGQASGEKVLERRHEIEQLLELNRLAQEEIGGHTGIAIE